MDIPEIYLTPPDLPGLTWRRIGQSDLIPVVELAAACFTADGGLHFLVEPESIIERFFPDGLCKAIGAFAADHRLAACASVHTDGSVDSHLVTLVGYVLPEWRNRGLGTYLLRWSQDTAHMIPVQNDDPRKHVIRNESLTESARQLYLKNGFKLDDEHLVMRRVLDGLLPVCPFPGDVTFTTWHPDLLDQFHQAYYPAFRERPGFPGFTAAEWMDHWMTDNVVPDWSLLALAGGVPAGFVIATTNPPHGFIVQVGVIPSQRRRGLSSALMVESMRRMETDGLVSAQLTVSTNNPGAIQTYNQLGFTTIGRRARYVKFIP